MEDFKNLPLEVISEANSEEIDVRGDSGLTEKEKLLVQLAMLNTALKTVQYERRVSAVAAGIWCS